MRPVDALSPLSGFVRQSYTENSSKSVRIESGSFALHAYRRSWYAGSTSWLMSTAGFLASTKNFRSFPMRKE